MTIKTTIALEFGNLRHRDAFLRSFQLMLFTFGNKAPKVKVTTTQTTEAEFGDPSALDLWFIGVKPAGDVDGLIATLHPDTPIAKALDEAERTQPGDAGPELEAAADASDAAREEAEVAAEVATEAPALPASLTERLLQTLATFGPLTVPALAMQLSEGAEAVEYELERLHIAGDVEPDDGGIWRLNDAE